MNLELLNENAQLPVKYNKAQYLEIRKQKTNKQTLRKTGGVIRPVEVLKHEW